MTTATMERQRERIRPVEMTISASTGSIRMKGLPAREANRRLRACSADETLQTVLRRYPWWKLPRMQAAFAFAMRFRMARLQRWMVALREKL